MSVQKGDRVRILDGRNGPGWLIVGAEATVDYLLPEYGKIICVLDEPSCGHTSCCLYESQEGGHWERAA
jgi:hypothetical protein